VINERCGYQPSVLLPFSLHTSCYVTRWVDDRLDKRLDVTIRNVGGESQGMELSSQGPTHC
jgi:hypothetical protein